MYTTASVVMAFALVALVTFSLTLFATRTSYDVTKTFYPYLIAVTVAMVGAGLFLMLFPSDAGSMVYAAIGAVLFSVYIVFDTQMIVGGKSEMQYSVEDYVPATIALYIDIVSLFIYMLQLFGEQRRD
jgi:FtsH-binding integral membrane protein